MRILKNSSDCSLNLNHEKNSYLASLRLVGCRGVEPRKQLKWQIREFTVHPMSGARADPLFVHTLLAIVFMAGIEPAFLSVNYDRINHENVLPFELHEGKERAVS